MTRVYVGAPLDEIDRWRSAGEVPVGTVARAVTAEVVEALDDSDDEEREYAVSQLAAEDSLDRSHTDARIAVLVAERADTEPAGDTGSVRIKSPLPWREVVAILVDESARVGAGAGAGDGSRDRDLAWYTPAELDALPRGDD